MDTDNEQFITKIKTCESFIAQPNAPVTVPVETRAIFSTVTTVASNMVTTTSGSITAVTSAGSLTSVSTPRVRPSTFLPQTVPSNLGLPFNCANFYGIQNQVTFGYDGR